MEASSEATAPANPGVSADSTPEDDEIGVDDRDDRRDGPRDVARLSAHDADRPPVAFGGGGEDLACRGWSPFGASESSRPGH